MDAKSLRTLESIKPLVRVKANVPCAEWTERDRAMLLALESAWESCTAEDRPKIEAAIRELRTVYCEW